ncbi:MAG: patatin-like phospholipase family protein [Clostridia bacterium]|nr:patatin-like phospholipase family protein [Clostridia bacterium]
MLGLALEGGGARGAFQMGVLKAYFEEGDEFDGLAGTSIGALNGAIIAQDSFEEGYKLWEEMSPSRLFDIEDEEYQRFVNRQLDKESIINFAMRLRKVIKNRGIDTSRIKSVLESIISEEKLRQSHRDFGLVTVSVTDLKPFELFKEDIPQGKMVDYLIASASFPGFKPHEIDEKHYIDGGFYNNCPINLLARKGYKDIIAVRTLGIGLFRSVKEPDLNVTYVLPSEDLGRILDFNNDLIRRNMQMGYYDAVRKLKKLKGTKYCIKPIEEDRLFQGLCEMPEALWNEMGKLYGLTDMDPKRVLFERVMPEAAGRLGLPANAGYQDIFIGLLERLAEEKGLNKYEIYSLRDFIIKLRETEGKEETSNKSLGHHIRNRLVDTIYRRNILNQTAQLVLDLIPQDLLCS